MTTISPRGLQGDRRRRAGGGVLRSEHGVEDWDRWWASVAGHERIRELIEERTRRFADREAEADRTFGCPSLAFHMGALAEADFRELDTIWQDLDHRVLLAVR